MKRLSLTLAAALPVLAALGLSACQSAIPNELADARQAYRAAAQGPAATYDPAALHKAKTSLELAEKTYSVEGDSPATRDRAYVATRQAQLATVQARTASARIETARLREKQDREQEKALEQARESLSKTQRELQAEREAREQAEQRAEQARSALEKFATVKREDRGTVITLTGQVLFQLGKHELTGPARARLSMVANSLTTTYADKPLVIEGHTDNQGSDELNQRLSQKRAEAVGNFLIEEGVAKDRVETVGMGESRPIASNDTSEGRANNRRVEIVIGGNAGDGADEADAADSKGEGATPGGEAQGRGREGQSPQAQKGGAAGQPGSPQTEPGASSQTANR